MLTNILLFALGIVLVQQQASLWPLPILLGSSIGLFLLWRCIGQRENYQLQLISITARWVLCALLGVMWATWRGELRLAEQLPQAWEGQDVRVRGYIASLPQAMNPGYRFVWRTTQVITPTSPTTPMPPMTAMPSLHFPSQVLVSFYPSKLPPPWGKSAPPVGSAWELSLRLKRPHGGANPFGFDYEAWLFERNLRATGYVRPEAITAVPLTLSTLEAINLEIEKWREQLRQRFWNALPERDYPYVGILIALVIGDQSVIESELWPLFSRTGVTHLLSVSGLHVTLVSGLFAYMISGVWRRFPYLVLKLPSQQVATITAAIAALLYSLLAGFAVPAQRTLYMLLVAAVARLSHRYVVSSQILAYALGVVLLLDPWAVLAPGFWLSFIGVAALLWVSQGRETFIPTSAAIPTPTPPSPTPIPLGRWQKLLSSLRAWGLSQWAATLASLPILLLIFQQFSLVSPLANAVAIPVISLLVTPLALLAAILPWSPLLYFLHEVLSYLLQFLQWCAQWPVWYAAAPPWWAALAAAIGAFLLLLPRAVPGRNAAWLLISPLLFWQAPRPALGDFALTVLDVGQGLAVVLQTQQETLVFDTGPQYRGDSDAGQRVLVPFLRAMGVSEVSRLVVSHDDNDHAGGVLAVTQSFAIKQLYLSRPVHGLHANYCRAGEGWEVDGVTFTFLHPSADNVAQGGSDNHLSCVLLVQSPHAKVLLTADIEAEAENLLLQRYPKLPHVDALLVPHHGSRTSSSPAFVQALQPHAAIFSVGYRNRFGHPKPTILARYAKAGSQLWRTDEDGAIQLWATAKGIKITAIREQNKRYWGITHALSLPTPG